MTCKPRRKAITVRAIEAARGLLESQGRVGPGAARARRRLRKDATPLPRYVLEQPGFLPTYLLTRRLAVGRAHAAGLVVALTGLTGGPR